MLALGRWVAFILSSITVGTECLGTLQPRLLQRKHNLAPKGKGWEKAFPILKTQNQQLLPRIPQALGQLIYEVPQLTPAPSPLMNS